MGHCRVITQTESVVDAMAYLRSGYPSLPFAQQSHGKLFMMTAAIVLRAVAEETLRTELAASHDSIVVVVPWRAGLGFWGAYHSSEINRFYHISAKRDELTHVTAVDYIEDCEVREDDFVVIADPMLATGNTTCDAIGRMLALGVRPDHIIVNAVVAAPEGIEHITGLYPETRIVVAALDQKLDQHGFIVPGLGDFGDKCFSGMTRDEKIRLSKFFNLSPEGELRLLARFMAS